MITYYLYKPDNLVMKNDAFFKAFTYKRVLEDSKLRKIVEEVEQVSFDDNNKVISKLNANPISLSLISTGCKTLLNILVHKDKVFTIQECGFNIIDKLFTYNDISFYCDTFLLPDTEFTTDVIMKFNGEDIIFHSLDEMEAYYYDIYTHSPISMR